MLLQEGVQLLGAGDGVVQGGNVKGQAPISPSVGQQQPLFLAHLHCTPCW